MISPYDLRRYVITPTLEHIGLYSLSAEILLVGTFYTESTVRGHTRLHQLSGPALGGYQIEPATHKDVWVNYLSHRTGLAGLVESLISPWPSKEDQLITNLNYATAIARVLYYRHREPLPRPGNYVGLAAYWKKYYNTVLGSGETQKFVTTLENLI